MKCPLCKKEVYGSVCKNCGCVIQEEEYDFVYDENRSFYEIGTKPMTVIDKMKTRNRDLRRAIGYHTKIDIGIPKISAKIESIKHKVKIYCQQLKINEKITDNIIKFVIHLLNKDEHIIRKGISYDEYAIGFIYLYIRLKQIPVLVVDFEKIGFDKKQLYNIYSTILKRTELYGRICLQTPSIFVVKILRNLGIQNFQFEKSAISLSKKLQRLNEWTVSRDCFKSGVQHDAACIYLLGKDCQIFYHTLSDACGVGDRTIQKTVHRYKEKIRIVDEQISAKLTDVEEFAEALQDRTKISIDTARFLVCLQCEFETLSKDIFLKLKELG